MTVEELAVVELPDGYTRHDGGAAPVAERDRVECAIWTVHGVRFSGAGPAYVHIWEWVFHDDGNGAVVGWKFAE